MAAWRSDLADRAWTLLGGGLSSLNFRSDDLVLRIAVRAEHNLAKEAALLRDLPDGVRAPKLLDACADALLLEYVPHVDLPGTAAAGARAGAAAKALHARTQPAAGLFDDDLAVPEPFPSAYAGLRDWGETLLLGRAGEKLGDGDADRVRALLAAEDARLRAAGEPPVLLHGDFKPANLKWLPDEGEVLVLDWEFAWAGPALFDAGQLLRWGVPDAFADAFAEAHGGLPDDWRRTAELFDVFNLLGFLDREDDAPTRDRDVLRRLEETLR